MSSRDYQNGGTEFLWLWCRGWFGAVVGKVSVVGADLCGMNKPWAGLHHQLRSKQQGEVFCSEREILRNRKAWRPKIGPLPLVKMRVFVCIIESKRYLDSLYEEQEGTGRVLGTHALLSLQMFHFILHTYIYVYWISWDS